MKEAAQYIKEAVLSHRPVIIRHHADADGISGGLLLEKACRSLIPEKKKIDLYITRKPTFTPFYDTADALRDISMIRRLNKGEPILIMVDFGSTEESFKPLRLIRPYVKDIIIIDHHPPTIKEGICEADEISLYHINPYLFDMDKNLTAGIQCYELARLISDDANPLLAAISAVGDKSDMTEYIQASGRTREELIILSSSIDFVASTFRNDPMTELMEEIISSRELPKKIYEILDIDNKIDDLIDSVQIEVGKNTLAVMDLGKIRYRYPLPGKLTGLIFERLSGKHPNLVVLGVFNGSIIIRQSTPIVPVGEIIAMLKKDFPRCDIEGGGHDVAGTIQVPEEEKDNIIEKIKGYILQTI